MAHRVASILLVVLVAGCGQTTRVRATSAPVKGDRVILDDRQGQVERIAAGGHLLVWSVRTPADRVVEDREVSGSGPPLEMPTASQVVIADERGGPRLTVDLGRRWVSALQMLHGPGGRAEPQLAIKSCAEPAESSCQDELLTLTPQAPLTVTKRISGEEATAAVAGRLDRGRRVQRPPNARGKCAVALTVREPDGSTRTLPRLPARAREYRRCKGLEHEQIAGDHVYAWIRRAAPGHDFEATFVYAFDLAAGPSARWHERYRPYRYTPGSYGWALGPGTTDRGQYWLETDTEFEHPRNACDIAATDTAVYRLDNPRCTVFYGEGTRGAIRRISDATFVPATP